MSINLENLRLSRRQFLEVCLLGGGGYLVGKELDIVAGMVYEAVMADRRVVPDFLPSRPTNSMFFGATLPTLEWNTDKSLQHTHFGCLPEVRNYFLKGWGYRSTKLEADTYDAIHNSTDDTSVTLLSWGEYNPLLGSEYELRDKRYLEYKFNHLFEQMKRIPGRKIFRPYFEFNIQEFMKTWYGIYSPQSFVGAWKHMANLLHAVDTYHEIDLCWAPNARTKLGFLDIRDFYPGSEYVDFIGLDVYSMYSKNPFDVNRHYFTPDLTPMEAVGAEIKIIQGYNKPWFVTETNISREFNQGEWITQLMNIVERTGGQGVMPFLMNKLDTEEKIDWNIPAVVDAVKNRIHSQPYYRKIAA